MRASLAGRFRRPGSLALATVLGPAGCTKSRPVVEKPVTRALPDTGGTDLARRVDALGGPGDGRSGIRVVTQGAEALALRRLLSRRAEGSIDAQYYILHDDVTGHLFAGELLKAADRGVRGRLLLDDMYTAEHDAMSAAPRRHPNTEIRLFNPFRRDIGRALGGLLDLGRVNRRMHNKSMTFDNQVTIVGGRNIGDEYFAADERQQLRRPGPARRRSRRPRRLGDLRCLLEQSLCRAGRDGDRSEALPLDQARARLMALYAAARTTEYGEALSHDVRREIQSNCLDLSWVLAEVAADPPEKAAGATTEIPASEILPVLRSARREVVMTSAYFVPGERGTALPSEIARRGVHVIILTNSLESNDVEPAHGHCARYRKKLLEAGVELWELRPDRPRPDRAMLDLGRSLSGLHAKAFAVDGRHLFIGSFNWDPRSVRINTEMGIMLDAPEVTQEAVRRLRGQPARLGLPAAAGRDRRDHVADPSGRRHLAGVPARAVQLVLAQASHRDLRRPADRGAAVTAGFGRAPREGIAW